jgi:branched-chain amino acid transport system permease protein
MHQTIQLAILGATAGALYALMASGLMITFRSSKVVNFAHGAIATFATFASLHAFNEWGWPIGWSIALSVAIAMTIGMSFQVLVLRPLRSASNLARVVATLGLLIAVNSSVIPVFDVERPRPARLFNGNVISLPFGSPRFIVPFDRVALTVVTIVILVLLFLLYRFTTFGRATRAAADNQLAASLLGYSPNAIELVNWALGTALAAVAGILLSTITQPDPISLTLTMVAALAAALLARFRSFAILLLAGVGLGMTQAVLLKYDVRLRDWTGLVGWGQALPLILIVVAVVFLGRTVARKGAFDERPLPAARVPRRPLPMALMALVGGTVWLLLAPLGAVSPTTKSLIAVILALSVVVLTGYAGQISLVQMGFAGFGAFVAARLAQDVGLPFPLPVFIGGLAAVPLGIFLGLPALRVRGLQLAIVTLGAAIVLDVMFFANRGLTGGETGLTVPEATLGPIDLSGITERRAYAIFVLFVTVAAALAVAALRSSRLGSQLVACRSNERGAAAAGLSVARLKLTASAIAALLAGIAGGLTAYRSTQVTWTGFGFMASILLVVFVYLGGIASISGAVVAGVMTASGLLAYYVHFEGTGQRIYEVVGGLGVMMVVVLHPDGVSSIPTQVAGHLRARRSSHGPETDADAPAAVELRAEAPPIVLVAGGADVDEALRR